MALSAKDQRNLYDRVNRLVLLCEDLLHRLPGTDVTLGEAVAFLYRDRQAGSEATTLRDRRKSVARRGADVEKWLPDLFGEEPT